MRRAIIVTLLGLLIAGCAGLHPRHGKVDTVVPSTTTTTTTQPVELLPPLYQYGPTGPTEDDTATLDAYRRCLADGPRLHLVRCDIERNAVGELEVIGYPANTLPDNK